MERAGVRCYMLCVVGDIGASRLPSGKCTQSAMYSMCGSEDDGLG